MIETAKKVFLLLFCSVTIRDLLFELFSSLNFIYSIFWIKSTQNWKNLPVKCFFMDAPKVLICFFNSCNNWVVQFDSSFSLALKLIHFGSLLIYFKDLDILISSEICRGNFQQKQTHSSQSGRMKWNCF